MFTQKPIVRLINSAVIENVKYYSTKPAGMLTNRNPRNLERMRIGYKPCGYWLDKPGRSFWHKLELEKTGRHITASVVHFENGEVLRVSTQEWGIKSQLYKTTDTAALINIARVLAQRCLQTGLLELACFIDRSSESTQLFLKTIEDAGVYLTEPKQFLPIRPWDRERPERPWEVTE